MNNDTSLTPQEAADRLRIAKNTVYELIKRGELKSYKVGRKIRIDPGAIAALKGEYGCIETADSEEQIQKNRFSDNGFVICGQDSILDILARRLEQHPQGTRAFRSHLGSYNGIYELYNGNAQMATAHLWDGDTGEYNVSYVKKMVPGVPVTVIRLVKRMLGFYVRSGNPKNIKDWTNLAENNIEFINREKGSGVRVLIDEKLRLLKINPVSLSGYGNIATTHLEAASAVARGVADLSVGNEKTALQVTGIDFIPIQQECYDLIMLKENEKSSPFSTIIKIIESSEFRNEVEGLGGYDVSEMGKRIL